MIRKSLALSLKGTDILRILQDDLQHMSTQSLFFNHDRTGWIPFSDTARFFNIENFTTAYPIEGLLQDTQPPGDKPAFRNAGSSTPGSGQYAK